MDNSKVYYFAYGSNMNENRMKTRGAYYSSRLAGKLEGYELQFNKRADANGIAYANIVIKKDSVVWGVLYEGNNSTLEQLDGYEGVIGNKEGHYYRESVSIFAPALDKMVDAVVYIACDSYVLKKDCKPSREYLSHLLAGKDLLPNDYFVTLQSIKTEF